MAADAGQTEVSADTALRKFDGSLIGDLPTLELPAHEKIMISFCSHRHLSAMLLSLSYFIHSLISSTLGSFPAVLTTPSITRAGVDKTP